MGIMQHGLQLLAHLLIGYFFVFFGFLNIFHWKANLQAMSQKALPTPAIILILGIAWQTIAGLMIMLNIHAKLAALLLIPFTIVSVLIFHPFWQFKGGQRTLNMAMFVSNMTVTLGALLLLL
jgi:putative oxidoreductase